MTQQELLAFLNTDEGRKAYTDFAEEMKQHCGFLPKSPEEFWDHETFADFERLYERRKSKEDRRKEMRQTEQRRKNNCQNFS